MKVPGGCACGSVRYECSAEPLGMGHCHCRDCQKASGTGYASVVVVPAASVKISGVEPKYYISLADDSDQVFRGFCPECGSPLFAGNETYKEFLGIKAGSLDDPKSFKPTIESWVSSAQPWIRLDPETRKFEKDLV